MISAKGSTSKMGWLMNNYGFQSLVKLLFILIVSEKSLSVKILNSARTIRQLLESALQRIHFLHVTKVLEW